MQDSCFDGCDCPMKLITHTQKEANNCVHILVQPGADPHEPERKQINQHDPDNSKTILEKRGLCTKNGEYRSI